jgi:hypothetical protein
MFACLILGMIISDKAYKELLPEEKSQLIELRSKSRVYDSLFFVILALFFALVYFTQFIKGPLFYLFAIIIIAYLIGEDIVFVKKLKKVSMPSSYTTYMILARIIFFSSFAFFSGILLYILFYVLRRN